MYGIIYGVKLACIRFKGNPKTIRDSISKMLTETNHMNYNFAYLKLFQRLQLIAKRNKVSPQLISEIILGLNNLFKRVDGLNLNEEESAQLKKQVFNIFVENLVETFADITENSMYSCCRKIQRFQNARSLSEQVVLLAEN
jgi:hypothetical protein